MGHLLKSVLFFVLLVASLQSQAQAPLCRGLFELQKKTEVSYAGSFDRQNTLRLRNVVTKKEQGKPTTILMLNSLTYSLQGIRKIILDNWFNVDAESGVYHSKMRKFPHYFIYV